MPVRVRLCNLGVGLQKDIRLGLWRQDKIVAGYGLVVLSFMLRPEEPGCPWRNQLHTLCDDQRTALSRQFIKVVTRR